MFAKITVFLAILVAVNATAHLGAVLLNHASPSKTILTRNYAAPVAVSHAVPVAVSHAAPVVYSSTVVRHAAPVAVAYAAPVAVAHSVPVAVAHAAPVGYSRTHESKYFGGSKYASAHGYSTHSEVNHGHRVSSSSTVVQHAAPVVVSHSAPLAVGHFAYNTGVLGHGLLGHRVGGLVYSGNRYIHY